MAPARSERQVTTATPVAVVTALARRRARHRSGPYAVRLGLVAAVIGMIAGVVPIDVGVRTAYAATLTVNSTADGPDVNPGNGVCETSAPGQCTLRAALQEANALPGADTIHFDIPTSDGGYEASPVAFRIRPSGTVLPSITGPVTIDGSTQPEFGAAGRPVIVLDGSIAPNSGDPNGLGLDAGSSTIRGLVIQNFPDDGIEIDVNGGNLIVGNYIGTDVTGTLARPNGTSNVTPVGGISIKTDGNTIGGTTAADRNVISGNNQFGIGLRSSANGNTIVGNYIGVAATGSSALGNVTSGVHITESSATNTVGGTAPGARNVISGNVDGIYLQSAGSDGNVIQGNYIGTDATGLVDLGNSDRGIQVESGADNTVIGGTAAGAGNVISGNGNDGVLIGDGAIPGTGTTGTLVQGNLIGVGADGTTPLGNTSHGVHITTVDGNLIGGTAAGAGNTIAHSSWNGVLVQNSTASANSILGNAIHSNGLIGIDLGDDGVTANDGGDGDSGANDLLNHPVITSAAESGGTVTVTFDLDVPADPDQFRVEFFTNPAGADPSGHGEGEAFVSAVNTSPGTGLTHTFAGSAGDVITATATRIDSGSATGFSSTSEFSAGYTVTVGLDPVVLDDVQKGSATIAAGSSSVNATITAVDPSKAFLVFSVRGNGNRPADTFVSGRLADATTVVFDRVDLNGTMSIEWSVVEFVSGVTVQRGTTTMSSTTVDVPISAVDLGRSFPITTIHNAGNNATSDDFVRAELINATNLRLSADANGNLAVVDWQVVTYNDAVVQSGTLSFAAGDASRTAAVTAVDTSKSWLVYSLQSPTGTSTNLGQKHVRGLVQNPTTLAFDRSDTGQTMDLTWYIVEFTDSTEVQHASVAFGASDTQQDVTITAVDPARSIAVGGRLQTEGRSAYAADDNPGSGWFATSLTSSTNLQVRRDAALAAADLGWFVISWPASSTPPVADDDSANTLVDVPVDVDVLANDSDPNGDTITIQSVTQGANGTVVNNGSDVTYTPDAGWTGTDTFAYTIDDGNGGTDSATVTVTVNDVTPGLWLSTLGDVGSPSGAPGLGSWSAGAILQFADPGLALEPPATAGTFSLLADLDAQGQDGNVVLTGLDLVTSAITVGGSPSVTLQAGDLLLSTDNDETFVNWDASTTATLAEDVVLFRPRTAGDYTSGTFSVLLQAPLASVVDVSLLERATTVGETTLPAGTFVLSSAKVVYELLPTAAGPGVSPGTPNVLVNGPDVAIDQNIVGVHLVDDAVQMDGIDFFAGDLLVSIDNTDSAVGDNGLSVVRQDVFRLRLTATTAGSGTAAGDATLVFDGSDVGLDAGAEDIEGVVLVGGTPISAPIAADDAVIAMRNDPLPIAPLVNDADPNGDALSIQSFTQPANGAVTDNGDGTVTYTPDFGFAGSDSFTYTVTDGAETDTATVTVDVRTPELRVATSSNVVASGTLGITSWTTSELLSIGDPSFALDPPTTSGTVGSALDLGAFSADGVVRVTAAHRVTTPVTIGSGGGSFDLEPGDLVLAFTDSETLVGDTTSISVANKDVVVFRPTSPGAPQAGGEFFFLLDDPTGGSINGLAVVERDTIVGDTVLSAGTLLFAYSSSSKVVLAYEAITTGELTTAGTPTTLADMSDVGLGGTIDALAIVERETTAGGRVLAEATLLLSTDGETTVAGLPVQRFDLFGVSITQTTLVSGTTVAASSMVFDGSDAFFDDNTESLTAATLFALPDATAGNTAPVAVDDAAATGPNQSIVIDVVANDTDADLDTLSIVAVTDGANGTVVDNGDGTVTYTRDALFVGTDTFGYRIDDGNGATDTAIVTITADPATGALALWRNSGSTIPQYSRWSGVAFGPTQSSAGVGEWRTMQAAEAPTRDEAIAVGVDTAGVIRGERWDGSTWSALPFNPMATVTESFWQGLDVAYEGLSGDAVLVWNNGSTGTAGITYRVWNGSTWTSAQTITTPLGGEPKNLRLVPDPRSDAMILIASNGSSQDYALVWDGSSWGDSIVLSASGTGDLLTDVSAAWQTESGKAIAVYGKGAASAYTRTWDGSSWGTETAVTPPAGSSGTVRWALMASDPGSDRIALGVLTSANSIWFGVHDGTSWGLKQLATTTANGNVSPNLTVGFESDTGDLLAVYGTASSNLTYRLLPNGGSWSAAQIGPSVGATQNTMVLSPDPNGDRMMLAAHVDNSDLDYVLWDGAAWGLPYEPTTNTGEVQNQPFEFVWDANQGVARPAHDITGTIFEDVAGNLLSDGVIGDANNPGAAGVDVHLYRDTDGDGIAEATDTFVETVQTAVDGTYAFTGKSQAKYFVVVDSTTVTPTAGLTAGSTQGDVWAEQTYGPAFSDCADGSGGTAIAIAPGSCYGGRTGGASDDLTTWYSGAEHLTRVTLGTADVGAVDFGFSFDVVTTMRGGDATDDDAGANRTVQGSLRQFLQNANAVTGANTMRFVPAEPTNATDGGSNTWWKIAVTNALPVLVDAATTIDGTARDLVDGVTVRQTNTAAIGVAGSVGVGVDGRPATGDEATLAAIAGPELEIADGIVSGRLLRGIDTDADDTTVRALAIWGFGGATQGDVQAGGDAGDTSRTGFLLEDAVVGSTPVGADPGTEASVNGVIVDDWANGTIRRTHVAHATAFGVRFGNGLPNWNVVDNHVVDNGSDGIMAVADGSFTFARNRFDGSASGLSTVDPPMTVIVADNTFTGNITEGAAIGDLSGSVVTRNLFENNGTVGLWISAVTTDVTDNTMRLNGTIGMMIPLGNTGLTAERNLIDANTGRGVYVYTATGVSFTDNEITNNGSTGVHVVSAGSTFTTNTITGNGGPGITVSSGATSALLDRNVFGGNAGVAIDLSADTAEAGDGITANDAAPPSCGTAAGTGNLGLDTPIVDDVSLAGTATVSGRGCANATIQVYRAVADGDGSDTTGGVDHGEGVGLLGTTTADASGSWSVSGLAGLGVGDTVSAVTISSGRTSEFSANVAVPLTATVNSAGDDGDAAPGDGSCSTGGLNSEGDPECTLRAAIEEANALATADTITFAIPVGDPGHGAGVWTLTPATPLPSIDGALVVDATTQPGWTARPVIELAGSSLAGTTPGIRVNAANVEVRSLAVVGFPDDAVTVSGDDVTIAGMHVGVGADGATAAGNGGDGVVVTAGDRVTIGGTGTADGNVIGNQAGAGIVIVSGADPVVRGNLVGVQVDGSTAAPNGSDGITTGAAVTGATIGGRGTGEPNTIAHNGGHGVRVELSAQMPLVVGNRIHDNAGLGIDIGSAGVTPPDAGDVDGVPNQPTLLGAWTDAGITTIDLSFDAAAGDYLVDYYANPGGADPSGYGEGEQLVATVAVTHDGSGPMVLRHRVAATGAITATATATATSETSEFSNAITAVGASAASVGDSSVRRSDLVVAGGAPVVVAGAAGGAIRLDGIDDHLVGPGLDVTDGAIQLGAWVWLDTAPAQHAVISKRDGAGNVLYELAVDGPTGEAVATVGLSGVAATVRGGAVTTAAWHQLAASWTGAELILYVDGAEVDRVAAVGILGTDPATRVVVGARDDGSRRLDGRVDHVEVGHDVATPSALAARHANVTAPGTFVTLGAEQTSTPGAWTTSTAQQRSGTASLAAPETTDAGGAGWAVATGLDEAGVVFESWWWVSTASGVDLAAGTRVGSAPTDQYEGASTGVDWRLRRRLGTVESVDATSAGALATGAWVEVEVWTDQLGDSRIVVDGVEAIGWTSQGNGSPSGSVALRAGALPSGEQWYVDDARARKLVTPEPVASLGALDRG